MMLRSFVALSAILFFSGEGWTTIPDGSEGNVEVTDTSQEGGNNTITIDVKSLTDKVKIKKVWHWDPWTEDWDDITSQCTYPVGFANDPAITLPEETQNGDKFRVRVEAQDGPDADSSVDVLAALSNVR